MRKNLIFAMMALGMMASCSKDTYVDAPSVNPEGEDQPMPVLISARSNQLSVATRGTGVVGGTDDATNLWNKQPLFITGFAKNVGTGITTRMTEESAIFFNKKAVAPADDAGAIAPITWENAGEVVYFPRNGAYDFFGYHADDAATGIPSFDELADGVSAGVLDTLWSVPVTIDGSQDLMIAKSALTPQDSLDLARAVKADNAYTMPAGGYATDTDYDKMVTEWSRAFSSYTARKNIQPTMQFKHLLTRLTFNVQGAKGVDGADEVFVRAVRVKSKTTGKLVFAYKAEKNSGIQWDINDQEVFLEMQEMDPQATTTGNLTPLVDLNNGLAVPDLSTYTTKQSLLDALDAGTFTGITTIEELLGKYHSVNNQAQRVGESLMLNPGVEEYIAEVEVMQYYDGNGKLIPAPAGGKEYTKEDARWYKYTLNINAKDVTKLDNGNSVTAGITQFAAGNSYNITILVNGYQDIKIKASLGMWVDGGNIELNPDDNQFEE